MSDDLLAIAAGVSSGLEKIAVPYFLAEHQDRLARDKEKRVLEQTRMLNNEEREGKKVDLDAIVAPKLGMAPGKYDPSVVTTMGALAGKEQRKVERHFVVNEKGEIIKEIKGEPGEDIGVTKTSPNMVPILDTEGNVTGYTQKGAIRPKAITQHEGTNATYANRIEQANSIFDSLEKNITGMSTVGLATQRALPNFLQKADMQSQEQAERNFVNATLRRESGAVISPSEFKEARRQYFPQPGDSTEVLRQKKQNREIVKKTFITGAGKAYSPASLDLPEVDRGDGKISVPKLQGGSGLTPEQRRSRIAELRSKAAQ